MHFHELADTTHGTLTRLPHRSTMPDMESGGDAVKHLVALVRQATLAGASDIHISREADGTRIDLRLDGRLSPHEELPAATGAQLCGRIKYLAHLKTYQESLPQDGRIAGPDLDAKHDLRVSTYPTVRGEKIVLRLFNASSARSLGDLRLPAEAGDALMRALNAESGLVLLTGPAGSGKTTTIYAALRHLATARGRHIITIEDPVEQTLEGVMQTEINEPRGLTFAVAARHLLRQDPQTLVIGEIRDADTCRVAVQGALTGHQVISTLHTGSCRGVFDRLNLLSADSYAAVTTLRLILNQRLVRIFCEKCKGRGCPDCLTTGFRGRVPVAEWFAVDDTVRARLQREGGEAIRPTPTLRECALALVDSGMTSTEEVQRVMEI